MGGSGGDREECNPERREGSQRGLCPQTGRGRPTSGVRLSRGECMRRRKLRTQNANAESRKQAELSSFCIRILRSEFPWPTSSLHSGSDRRSEIRAPPEDSRES